MTLTLQYAVDALNVGGLYAMMALGIGLIFGIMRLINFAHGELVMVGGYAMLLLVQLPGPLVLALSLIVVIVLALGMERLAFRPLREAAPSTLLVASFALSYFLQNFFVLVLARGQCHSRSQASCRPTLKLDTSESCSCKSSR